MSVFRCIFENITIIMFQIKSRIWVESSQGIFLGEGRIRLLRAIEQEGSLSKAAKSMNMSYKKAWNLIDAINKSAPKAIVETSTGGSGGGGTLVTKYGRKKMEDFEAMKQRCWDFIEQQNVEFNNQ